MLEIQYASDLHIDNYPSNTPFSTFLTPTAPVLILAGDICSAWNPLYKECIEWCSKYWKLIIIISGNHEYYCNDGKIHTLEQTDNQIRDICNQTKNTIFLQSGQSFLYKSVRFIGATLWSDIDPSIWDEVEEKKGDFHMTYVKSQNRIRKTHPSDISALYALHKARISTGLTLHNPNEKIVVITHHIPTTKLLESRYKTHPWNSCYASNTEELFGFPIVGWICGHAHRSTRLQTPQGTMLFMNARGYNTEKEQNRNVDIYNPKATFFIHL